VTEEPASRKDTPDQAPERTRAGRASNGSNGANGSRGSGGTGGPGGPGRSRRSGGDRFGFNDGSFDQRFPVFTVDGTSLQPSLPDDQTPNVTKVLSDLLGWRPIPGDAKAFSAALTASFSLKHVEGHVESSNVPRGYAMQADLGTVTGGQASLYARARAGLTHMLMLLEGLTPLDPAFDKENIEATRSLVRNELTRIVDELGAPGGPRQALVDAGFMILLGTDTVPVPPPLPDDVGGQLGALRDRFGLLADQVNTVDEERIRTSFWTLSDEVQDLARAWDTWKEFLIDDDASGFLGTDFVLISRLMGAASEQVDEFERVLDSVLVGAAERQTIELDATGLTLDGLLSWTRRFLREDGRTYLTYSGRIGLVQAFEPTAARLVDTYQDTLIDRFGPAAEWTETGMPAEDLPFPPGMFAARVVIALQALFQQLQQIHQLALDAASFVVDSGGALGPDDGEIVGDVDDAGDDVDVVGGQDDGSVDVVQRGGDPDGQADPQALRVLGVTLRDATPGTKREVAEGKDERRVRISAHLMNPPMDATVVLVLHTGAGGLVRPVERLPRAGDVVASVFTFSAKQYPELAKLRWQGEDVQFPARQIPLDLRDLRTGDVLFRSPAQDWTDVVVPDPNVPPGWLNEADDTL